MLAMITFDYGFNDAVKKLSREQYAELRAGVAQLNLSEWALDKEEPPYSYISGKILVDLTTDGVLLTRMGFEYRIANFKNTYLADRVVRGDGSVVNVHLAVPNVGLLAIDEVCLLADACTDMLQQELNDGWRIVAVCPPNGARRPDYILGRTKT